MISINARLNFSPLIYLVLILLIFIIFLSVINTNNTTVLKEKIRESKLCFLNKTKSIVDNAKYNIDYIEIDLSKKPEISGRIIHKTIGGDWSKGEFRGAFDNNFLNIILNGYSGGNKWKEQRLYQIQDDKIFIEDYLEKTMSEGTKIILDISKVKFSEKNFIKKIPCNQVVEKDISF